MKNSLIACLLLACSGLATAADTTIRVDASYDPVGKVTNVKTRELPLTIGKTFTDPSAVVLFISGVEQASGEADCNVDVTYTSNSWKYLDSAMDADAQSLPAKVLGRRVMGAGKIQEHVQISVSRAYLQAHISNGLQLRLQGKEGDASFKIPPIFVHDFLAVLDGNQPGKPTAVAASEKPHFGAQLVPLQAAFAHTLGLPMAQGLLVVNVVPDSVAARAGLQQGDILLNAGGQDTNTEAALQQVLDVQPAGTTSVPLQLWRGGGHVAAQAGW